MLSGWASKAAPQGEWATNSRPWLTARLNAGSSRSECRYGQTDLRPFLVFVGMKLLFPFTGKKSDLGSPSNLARAVSISTR